MISEEREKPLRLRALVVATTFPRWANDTTPPFVYDLSRMLARNASLKVLAPHAPGAKRHEFMGGLEVVRFPYFYPKSLQRLCYDGGILPNLKKSRLARLQLPFFLAAQFFYIWKTARRNEIDLIHCHWIVPQGFFVAAIHKLTRIPYVLTAHGGDAFAFKGNALVSKLGRYAVKNARVCTVNSRATQQAVQTLYGEGAVEIVPMGVDVHLFNRDKYDENLKSELNAQDLFLLGVGRFAEKKGFQYLIQAMPLVLAKRPSAKLILVGFGPMEDELKKLVKSLNLEDSVSMPGSRSGTELAKFYATADIFIGPSIVAESGDTEGLGVVFLEAMASGAPVIASDVGGVGDIVKDGVTGLLVPQKDPQSIARKVLLLAGDADLRNELRYNGEKLARERFSWETIAQSFLRIFLEHSDQ